MSRKGRAAMAAAADRRLGGEKGLGMGKGSGATAATAAVICLLFGGGAIAQQAEMTRVGAAGDFGRMQVEGVEHTTAEQVRDALAYDWLAQLASTPTAAMPPFLSTVRARLTAAYRHAGYPDAMIEVRHDAAANRLVVRVAEGGFCSCGAVEVRGLDAAAAASVRRRMTGSYSEPRFKYDGPSVSSVPAEGDHLVGLWREGDAAPMDGLFVTRAMERARQAMALEGYLTPRVRIERVIRGGQVALVIEVQERGPRLVLGNVEVRGLDRSRAEDVVELLQIPLGDPITLDSLQEAQRRLWLSGRFRRHDLKVQWGDVDKARATLVVDVEEARGVPALHEPLSAGDQAVLRLAGWFEALGGDGTDVVCSYGGSRMTADLILSPRDGLLLALGGKSPVAVAMTAAGVRLWSGRASGEVTLPAPGAALHAYATLLPCFDPGKRFSVALGAGFHSRGDGQEAPVSMRFDLCPAALLEMLHDPSHRVSIASDGKLVVLRSEQMEARFRPATGELVSLGWNVTGERLAISTAPRALHDRVGALGQKGDGKSALSPGDVLAELVAQCAVVAAGQVPDERRAALHSGVARIAGALLGTPAEDLLALAAHSAGRPLQIPTDPDELFAGNPMEWAVVGLPFADRAFERGSWPWTLTRRTLMAIAGDVRYGQSELLRLEREQKMGPIGHVVAASLLARIDARAGSQLAAEGLKHLSADEFVADCRVLFAAKGTAGNTLRRTLQAVRQLSDGELAALESANPTAKALRPLVESLRQHPEDETFAGIEPILRRVWEGMLRAEVEGRLQRLAGVKVAAAGR